MNEKKSLSVQDYAKVLTKIKEVAEKNSNFIDNLLFLNIVTEKSEDCIVPPTYRHYGLIKNREGKMNFYFSESDYASTERKIIQNAEELAKKWVFYGGEKYQSPEQLKLTFLRQIGVRIEEREVRKARIDEKVKIKLSKIETELMKEF